MKCDLKVIVAALMYGTTMKQSQHKNPWPQKWSLLPSSGFVYGTRMRIECKRYL